ncbi:putative hemolysin [Ezakiella coagulans]|uniref:Putative hemolysin n=2 Tax=Ezakiella coagulans TaxID=46507 RepID=A0A2U1E4T2_9FIRM|nr:hemolysin family protein [Ezakiella coagulans]PVY94956.1 putative hemolysin [Ezakiella coagulans]UQK61158.1 hemolysin family protein [Ezakiella coagulans]
MDTDSCIRFVVFFLINIIFSFFIRFIRTSVMCAEFNPGRDEDMDFAERKEDMILSLDLFYNLVKLSFVFVLLILAQTIYKNLDLENSLSVVVVTLIVLVSLLIYDILTVDFPDRFGSIKPDKNVNSLKFVIYLFVLIIMPIYKTEKWLKNTIIEIFKLPDLKPVVTIDQITSMVELGEEQGILNSAEKEMIDGVMGFNSRVAEEIMTPRTEVFMVDINKKPEEYMDELAEYRYSRIPVYDDDIDNIVGVIYLKDIFKVVYKEGIKNLDIKKLIKPAYFVPERKNIHMLFQEMQREQRHLSLLMDEYGGFSGIVTMEDLTEEIMGDIDDEFDNDEPDVYALTTNEAVVQGSTSIKDINDMLGTHFPEDMDYDTISGFIINKLGYIPNTNRISEIEFENANIKILEVEDRRIKKVKITLIDIDPNLDTKKSKE